MGDVDLVNRDPNSLNDHIKVQFEDVLAEPEGAHSIDCVWKLSYTCFNCWLGLCYKLTTLCTGICIAAGLGCEFAMVAFSHIWCITPCLKECELQCSVFKRICHTCCECCLEPLCMSMGSCFHMFKK